MADRLTKQQIEEFRDAFAIFDRDGDGTISTSELRNVMRNLGQSPSLRELKELINEVDTDGNGEIDFDEFCTLMVKQLNIGDEAEEYEEAFKLFDCEGMGSISAIDLREVLSNLAERITQREISGIMLEVDPDDDGRISMEDFAKTFGFK